MIGRQMGGRGFVAVGLAAFALCGASCGQPPVEAMPSGQVAAATPSDDVTPAPVTAYQGTVAMLGDCGVGIARVDSDYADLFTYAAGRIVSAQRWLRLGQLLVACGTLHRVLGFVFEPGRAGVVLDGHAMRTTKISPGAVVLTLDGLALEVGPGRVSLKGLVIENQAERVVARFRVVLGDGHEQAAMGAAGDVIQIGSSRHQILEVRPIDIARGIPGWMEIQDAPVRPAVASIE